ncbi:MAG TPA: bifunctional adenosylcobinamide kinase/adenosylcobinamide-phosphate guanylyltransferase, partial [Chloroflexota bacterium]|nr:bifunctional adenosylcobinamide kinase/adenosylcobinamide-phosphate guanylyltransferase [Chloroflexota bacterium]
VLGGARSGKSSCAERLATECGEPVLYVATATAGDDEMRERIERHRTQRPASWRTQETPTSLQPQVSGIHTVLVEDLTLLLSNLMGEDASSAEARAQAEVQALTQLHVNVVLVSNEVGMGLVPPYHLGRVFRDSLGRLNQSAASLVDEAYFVVAGVPLRLK